MLLLCQFFHYQKYTYNLGSSIELLSSSLSGTVNSNASLNTVTVLNRYYVAVV